MSVVAYLASPYSHADASVREERWLAACNATARAYRAGLTVFSPIAHSHVLTQFGCPCDFDFWREHDLRMLERCDFLLVLTIDGYKESVGVKCEVAAAFDLGKSAWTWSRPDGRSPCHRIVNPREWPKSGPWITFNNVIDFESVRAKNGKRSPA